MSKIKKIIMHSGNGSDGDTLYPKTTIDQVENLQDNLDNISKITIAETAPTSQKSGDLGYAVDPVVVSNITVKTPPTTTEYFEGDSLSMAGLVITAAMSDDTTKDLAYGTTGITYSPAEGAELALTNTTVTIGYSNKTCYQSINITKNVEPLTFTIVGESNFDIAFKIESFLNSNSNPENYGLGQYSLNNGEGTSFEGYYNITEDGSSGLTTDIIVNTGDVIKVKGIQLQDYPNEENNAMATAFKIFDENGNAIECNVTGSAMSMWCGDNYANAIEIPYAYAGYRMFGGWAGAFDENLLPATILKTGCYKEMFYGTGAGGFTTGIAPTLPATELVPSCYDSMFYGCPAVNLTVAFTEGNEESTNDGLTLEVGELSDDTPTLTCVFNHPDELDAPSERGDSTVPEDNGRQVWSIVPAGPTPVEY